MKSNGFFLPGSALQLINYVTYAGERPVTCQRKTRSPNKLLCFHAWWSGRDAWRFTMTVQRSGAELCENGVTK